MRGNVEEEGREEVVEREGRKDYEDDFSRKYSDISKISQYFS